MAEPSRPGREDAEALLATRRELGPDYDDALLEAFVERVEKAVAEGSAPRPPEVVTTYVDQNAGARQLALAIVSLVAAIPLTAIVHDSRDAIVLTWVMILLVNVVHALQSRPRRQ
ncbi:hypothetical protein [Nocardioides marmoraquaticus]